MQFLWCIPEYVLECITSGDSPTCFIGIHWKDADACLGDEAARWSCRTIRLEYMVWTHVLSESLLLYFTWSFTKCKIITPIRNVMTILLRIKIVGGLFAALHYSSFGMGPHRGTNTVGPLASSKRVLGCWLRVLHGSGKGRSNGKKVYSLLGSLAQTIKATLASPVGGIPNNLTTLGF